MPANMTTFIISRDARDARDAVVSALTDLGFSFEPERRGRLTLLDTFDGRFHRADMRLAHHEVERSELVLAGDRVVEARLELSKPPTFAADLPPGPLRSRIGSITDVRALLPKVRIVSTRTNAARRDADGRLVASVALYEDIAIVESDDTVRSLPASIIEVHEVLGSRRPGRRAVEALVDLGLERIDGDVLAAVAAAEGIDLDGFAPSATVPLNPDMPAVEAVHDVLVNLADAIDANWQGTIDHIDPEFLHDLRVAVRRTRAVVGQASRVLPPDVVATAREGFGWLGGLTGPARDLDVYLIEWADYVRPLGAAAIVALEPVRELLQHRQAAAHAALDEAMSSPAAATLVANWRLQLAGLATEQQGAHADRDLGRFVRQRFKKAQTKLIDRGRLIHADTPAEQVHDLRKDAKKLRYLLECFASILPDAPRKQFVKRLKALQDNLGEHQDAEVHVDLIREVAAELHERSTTADTLLALGQLTERLEQIRVTARTEFADQFAAYDTQATQRAFTAMLEGIGS